VVLAAVIGVLIIGMCVFAYVDTQRKQNELAVVQGKLDHEKSDIKVAEAFVAKISYAQHWHGGQPRFLACLKDLTMSIPEDGSIFATGLTLHDSVEPGQKPDAVYKMKGTFSGKSNNDRNVLALLDRVKAVATGKFQDVKMSFDRGRSANDVSFIMSFTYVPPVEPGADAGASSSAKASTPAKAPAQGAAGNTRR
jgi:hypothetical protein